MDFDSFDLWKVGLHNLAGKVTQASNTRTQAISKARIAFCSQRVEACPVHLLMTLAAESTLTVNSKIKRVMAGFYGVSKTCWRI